MIKRITWIDRIAGEEVDGIMGEKGTYVENIDMENIGDFNMETCIGRGDTFWWFLKNKKGDELNVRIKVNNEQDEDVANNIFHELCQKISLLSNKHSIVITSEDLFLKAVWIVEDGKEKVLLHKM
ncbi:hypothetical protein [Peptostreptococcus faecalis]|uniref:hypothetical protein n=1 Tax=Peptostreptococcus faecalis TaxID=2045015 RepID=UPI000C7A9173|nr:hypothetical protein [Peptostreptococcus faecalis]